MIRRRRKETKQDKLEKENRRKVKKSRRRDRRERIASLVGLAAGYMFNTRMVGWVATGIAVIAGIILLMKLI